jgi:hypothetical protein
LTGEEHLNTISGMNTLARTLVGKVQLAEAVKMLDEIL